MKDLNKSNQLYFPNLDALRFLAFLLVFINHLVVCLGHKTTNPFINNIKTKYLLNGDLGVNFFFVLSGFLITYLLYQEKEKHSKVAIRFFYLRRILRIWPLYFIVLFIAFTVIPMFASQLKAGFPILTGTTVLNKNLYFFFLGNFEYVKNGITNAVAGVLWSVSIEEQFYLFCPLIIALVPRKHLAKAFIAIIVLSTYYRFAGTSGKTLNLMQLYHTFSCVSDLAMGALFAHLCTNERFIDRFKNINPYWIILIYIIGFTLIAFRVDIYHLELTQNEYLKSIHFKGGRAILPRPKQYLHAIMPTIHSLFFAFIVIEQTFANRSIVKIGKISIFSKLGKISYGLYCYHMIALFFVLFCFMKLGYDVAHPDKTLIIAEALIAFTLTIVISALSYRFIEKHLLLLKEKMVLKPILSVGKLKVSS